MTHTEIANKYLELKHANAFIYGFTVDGYIYYTVEKSLVYTPSVASRGYGNSLRFRPTKAQKLEMLKNAVMVCEKTEFATMCNNSKYNKGEIFEKLIHDINGLEWVKDSNPFYNSDDIVINGIGYEIKFEGATFTNEKIINNILARV